MAEYDLYYWPVPFRGEFVRALLAHAGKSWDEHDVDAIEHLMGREPSAQPVPFMGPPVLVEKGSGLALSQMPAIMLHLGDSLGLLPPEPGPRALTAKIVNDANDILDEITLHGGRSMWTEEKWEEFVPRLEKWMAIWEVTAARHGVETERGHLLGTSQAGVADIMASTLWSTMTDRFPFISALLDATAPRIAGLSRRLQATPALALLRQSSFEQYGQAYCGGQIEESLRRVMAER